MCTHAYDAPGPLFRDADHHNELMDLASRHDCHHPVDHTTPGDPYAELRDDDDGYGYDPADDTDDTDDTDPEIEDWQNNHGQPLGAAWEPATPSSLYLTMQADLRAYLARPDIYSRETASALLVGRWFELPLEEMGPFLDFATSLGAKFTSKSKMREYLDLQLHIEERAAKSLRERGIIVD